MASQKQLKAMFDGMNTAQKGNFISNLKKTLKGNESSENSQFLNECITMYNSELEADGTPELMLEAEPVVEPRLEAKPKPVIEKMFETEPEAEPVLEPELKPEPEPVTEKVLEAEPESVVAQMPEAESVVEPKLEAKPESVIDKMLETEEPEPVVAQKSGARVKPVSEPELEPEPEPIAKSETVIEPEPAPEAELGSEPETKAGLVSESLVEPELELEAEVEAGLVSAAQSSDVDDNGVWESVCESDIAPVASENRIDFITKEIYNLADNIRYNLCVIETISDLLSGKWHVELEVDAPVKKDGQTFVDATPSFGADTVGIRDIFRDGIATPVEFENTINYIEMKVSELADSIRHDVSVIGAISNLLSGTEIPTETAAVQTDEPEPVTDDSAPVADSTAPVADDSAPSDSGENKIDDAMKEFFEISESG